MVSPARVERARPKAPDFESGASTNSATRSQLKGAQRRGDARRSTNDVSRANARAIGAKRGNRTPDALAFNEPLYLLSYLGYWATGGH